MGCGKSRCSPWRSKSAENHGSIIEIYIEEETKVLLISTQTTQPPARKAEEEDNGKTRERSEDSSPIIIQPVHLTSLFEYAQRMSEDIVAQALQLCWEVNSRFKDFPFIDAEPDCII